MLGRAGLLGVALAVSGLVAGNAPEARGDEDVRTVARFVQALRDRGYYDLAAEYLDQIRKQADAPPDLVATAEFELGRMLLDEAARTGDLVRRRELLDQARAKLDAFTRANPNHPKAPEALVDLARMHVERGHLAMLQSDEVEAKSEKDAKVGEARAAFGQARTAYDAAAAKLKDALAKYPPHIEKADQRAERERVHTALMQARLQRAEADFELGETYPPGTKERADLMAKALAQFESIYKDYRTQLAGLAARMWMGKCYEERGDYGPAMGIYNELMEHSAPELRPLQRFVGYFRIITLGKRKEYALAADEAVRWLQANNRSELQRTKENLGVKFELAKDILAQLPTAQGDAERSAAVKRVVDVLADVVRYPSPFRSEALQLLKKYKPSAAVRAEDVARLSYDDAVAQGEQALGAQEWDRAAILFRHAVRRAEAVRDADKLNAARYELAVAYFKDRRYYPALVLAEHLARRYPHAGLSPRAAELGLAALAESYNESKVDRTGDLDHLVRLASYAAETYPDQEQGDTARMILGKVYEGTGRYAKAIEAFGAVRSRSSQYLEAQTRLGASHWEQSQTLRRDGKTAEADAEVAKAINTLKGALQARRDAGASPSDPGLINNACDLADVYLKSSRPDDALKLLEPLAQQQSNRSGEAFARLTAHLLRSHVALGQVDKALADMAALEKAGGGSNLTELYYRLGKLLETEMDALQKRNDRAGLERTKTAYAKFLAAVANSKTGQTVESLEWAGANMLKLGKPEEAEAVFNRLLKMFETDKTLQSRPDLSRLVLLTRLRLAAALRGERKFGEAESLVAQLIKENPKTVEPLMERGFLLEDEAAAGKAKWASAFTHWRTLALRLGAGRTKPVDYYEAWYHAALALKSDNKPREAKQTLASIMRLSPSVGGPEMKQKYQALLSQIR